MKMVLSAILSLGLIFTVACSSGGASDPNSGADLQKTQGGTSILGSWTSGALKVTVTNSLLSVNGQCEGGQAFKLDVVITVSPTELTMQEDKAAPCISLTKGMVLKFTVNGDKMDLTLPDGRILEFTRDGATPAPGNNGGENGGNGGEVRADVAMFAGANCQGNVVPYTKGMNCATLINSGNIQSIMQGKGQCQSGPQPQTAVSACEELNQAFNQQGRQ